MIEHWRASATQQHRVEQFEHWLVGYIDSARADKRLDDEVRAIRKAGRDAPFCVALQTAFGDESEQHLADFYLFPALHRQAPNLRARADGFYLPARELDDLLTEALKQLAGSYACSLGLQRLRFQLSHPADSGECTAPLWTDTERARIPAQIVQPFAGHPVRQLDPALKRRGNPFLEPDPASLARALCGWPASRPQLDELVDLMERSCDTFVDHTFVPPPEVEDGDCSGRMSTAEHFGVTDRASDLAQAFARLGPLDSAQVLRFFAIQWPRGARVVGDCLRQKEDALKSFKPEALDWIYAHCEKPLDEAIKALDTLAGEMDVEYERADSCSLSGIRFVVAAARLLAQMSSPPPSFALVDADVQRPAARVMKLLCNLQPLTAAESEALVAELGAFSQDVLQQLLRHCRNHADEVLSALGWGMAAPLYRFMREREKAYPNTFFDVPELQAQLERAGLSGESLLVWCKKYKHLKLTVRRIEAVGGVEDKKLAGLLEKLSQEHIRLWALYPLRDAADLRQRFDFFKGAGKLASKQFGSERSANVRDAAAAALVQLAHNAGFADVTEMEWSLDAGSHSPQDWTWQQGEYAVELSLQDFQPVLTVQKAGKTLKSLPPALKKAPEFAPVLAQIDQLKDQAKRYRAAMESLMVSGRALRPQQLQELAGLPMAQRMLTALYVQDSDGALGLLEPDLTQWRLLDAEGALAGTAQPVVAPLRIAHVYELLRAGRLIACQQHVVSSGLVQPFKQAFRECYVLTPAEREAGDVSRRFHGRRVKTAVLGAILSARGWRVEGSDFDFVARKRVAPDVFVEVSLPDVDQYLTQEEATVLDEVSFTRHAERIPLEQAPALDFSEAMRDLDLVITAGAADSDEHSQEVQQTRVALVSALIPGLGLKNVSVEGHHAIIHGTRASYRLHLGTAVIHVIPAGYLCIVPAAKLSSKAIALPFVDEDQRTSEVLSKLFLLSADGTIKDPSILAQIEGQISAE